MRVLKDFRCDTCNREYEALVSSHATMHVCQKCGNMANNVYKSFNFKLDGTDPGFPGAYDKWAREHEKAGRVKQDA